MAGWLGEIELVILAAVHAAALDIPSTPDGQIERRCFQESIEKRGRDQGQR